MLNDLWVFDIQRGAWTWIAGDSTVDQNGAYGTVGSDKLGSRNYQAMSYDVASQNISIFAGTGRTNVLSGKHFNYHIQNSI